MTQLVHMGRVVLIVEDDPTIRAFLRLFVQRAGCEALESGDGQEALHVIAGRTPDLIVTDLAMPNMDGPTLIRNIRLAANLDLATVPIIAVSGASDELQQAALAAGARAVLRKPVLGRTIMDAITQVLGPPPATAP